MNKFTVSEAFYWEIISSDALWLFWTLAAFFPPQGQTHWNKQTAASKLLHSNKAMHLHHPLKLSSTVLVLPEQTETSWIFCTEWSLFYFCFFFYSTPFPVLYFTACGLCLLLLPGGLTWIQQYLLKAIVHVACFSACEGLFLDKTVSVSYSILCGRMCLLRCACSPAATHVNKQKPM